MIFCLCSFAFMGLYLCGCFVFKEVKMRLKKGKKYLITHTEELIYFGGDKKGKIKLFNIDKDNWDIKIIESKNIKEAKERLKC